MRVGSLVFATDQGLGVLAKDFYDHGIVTDICVIRHGRRPEHDEWYPDSIRIGDLRRSSDQRIIHDFCEAMDAMLFFETPFLWELFPFCKRVGVKTSLMSMHECMPDPLPAEPDVFLCPSLLDLKCYPRGIFLPVPVPDWVRAKHWTRSVAKIFVHNAGNGGLRGRNGTQEFLDAIPLVRSEAQFLLRSQVPIDGLRTGIEQIEGKKVDVRIGTCRQEWLYDEGDVFVFPEKFNGLSLPLQEACAAGMLVMSTDRFPINCWLPNPPLIPSRDSRRARVAGRCREYDEAQVHPTDIARKIDEWYGRDISTLSLWGKRWAKENSWEVLGPRYREALEKLP